MGCLFRFRSCSAHSLMALSNLSIEGSIYDVMGDKKEVLLSIDVDRLCKISPLDRSIIKATADLIRNHVLSHYYIACFSKTNQLEDLDMWETYAGTDGFCLVYDEIVLNNAIKLSMMKNKGLFHIFRDVDYGKEATDITPFVEDYLRIVGNDIYNEEAYVRATKIVGNSFDSNLRTKIINSMFHKIGVFPEKSEKRIVTLKSNSDGPFDSDLLMIKVKPSIIICSSKMPNEQLMAIEKIAKDNKIEFRIHNMN